MLLLLLKFLLLLKSAQLKEESENGFEIALSNFFSVDVVDSDALLGQEDQTELDVVQALAVCLGFLGDLGNFGGHDGLDDFSKNNPITKLGLEILDLLLAAVQLVQVVVGPVGVDFDDRLLFLVLRLLLRGRRGHAGTRPLEAAAFP